MALKCRTSEKRRSRRFPEADSGADCLESPVADPEAQLSWKQHRARLLNIVRALPAQDRNCLELRAEGFRYRDIARILGVSLGSVANSLARALTRLGAANEVSRR
jgi:RNA polymerase sigma-70 factor (ECF subfamily)